MNNGKKMVILFLITVSAFCLNIFTGWVNGSLWGIFSSDMFSDIMLKLRIPRALTALAAGGTFALCGAVFQSLFRNPIASPFTLGTASGASFGVTVFITFIGTAGIAGIALSSVFAFGGALLSMAVVYTASVRKRKFDPGSMILTGVLINFFFSSLILFIQYISDKASAVMITRWTMGGIDIVGMPPALFIMILFTLGTVVIFFFKNDLNLMYLGEDISVSRGVDPDKVRKKLFIVSSLMISGVVAFTGPIGFIGIISPHISSVFWGRNYRWLLPASLMTGASFLLICDIISRTVLWPVEIPVGIITALTGVPFFIRLLSGSFREK